MKALRNPVGTGHTSCRSCDPPASSENVVVSDVEIVEGDSGTTVCPNLEAPRHSAHDQLHHRRWHGREDYLANSGTLNLLPARQVRGCCNDSRRYSIRSR